MGEQENESKEATNILPAHPINRRTFLALGATAAATGLLAACQNGSGNAGAAGSPTATPTNQSSP
ncbi:MAG TPA: hypothetical protein DHW02_05735, partial [Ktedonobacter sp.]|nr:hypothetical protein [Ktedonobacter sp.]